jgi:uncharacterized protein (TIGR03086 family)
MSAEQLNRVRDLDRAAVLAAAEVGCRVRPADLDRATPCAGWTVADLLNHLSIQHRGFAAAARGEGGDLAIWAVRPPAPDPVADFLAATAEVLTAFAADGVETVPFRLPEVSTAMAFPAAQAVSFHFIDYVVHSWDLARSIGTCPDLDQPVLEAALPVAQQVPGEARDRPGSPFGPMVPVPADAPRLDRIVAHLGRQPDWTPPAEFRLPAPPGDLSAPPGDPKVTSVPQEGTRSYL